MNLYKNPPKGGGVTQTKDEKLKKLADWLIYTLSTDMEPKKADKIVKDVALAIYNDILGIKGEIVGDSGCILYNDPSFDYGVRGDPYTEYSFKKARWDA